MPASSLDRATVEGVSRLTFDARRVVEGLRSGQHRSPFFGSSVEFAEHKEYAPGDDLRNIDWKLYGKADRYYVKRFEEETNLVAWLLVDQSASMTYAGTGLGAGKAPWWRRLGAVGSEDAAGERGVASFGPHVPEGSKLAWATLLAASIAYLLIQQGDRVGLMTYGGGASEVIAPRSQPSHLGALMTALVKAPSPGRADIASALSRFSPRLRQRGVVIVISDLLEDPEAIFQALKGLRPMRQDLSLFHVLDPDELTFPFTDVARFQDPEDRSAKLLADPQEIREAYLEEFQAFLEDVRSKALDTGVDYALMSTGTSVLSAIQSFLQRRQGRGTGRRR